METDRYRLLGVAVGKNQYIAFNPSYEQLPRAAAGRFVDLTHTFATHAEYASAVEDHARTRLAEGYLLKSDADARVREAARSDVGEPKP